MFSISAKFHCSLWRGQGQSSRSNHSTESYNRNSSAITDNNPTDVGIPEVILVQNMTWQNAKWWPTEGLQFALTKCCRMILGFTKTHSDHRRYFLISCILCSMHLNKSTSNRRSEILFTLKLWQCCMVQKMHYFHNKHKCIVMINLQLQITDNYRYHCNVTENLSVHSRKLVKNIGGAYRLCERRQRGFLKPHHLGMGLVKQYYSV